MTDFQLDPKFMAGVDMLRRTGCKNFRIGYTDEADDGKPVIWHATVSYSPTHHEAAAALDPILAVMRLCEQLIDGGTCVHCRRNSIFIHDTLDFAPLERVGCVTAYDPELKTFRRGCE